MTYDEDKSVRVHLLNADRLEELTRTHLNQPWHILWLADRLLVHDYHREPYSETVFELAPSGTGLERLRDDLIDSTSIGIFIWTADINGLVIFGNINKNILHYKFT